MLTMNRAWAECQHVLIAKADQLSALDTNWLDYYFGARRNPAPAVTRLDGRTGFYSTLQADGTWKDDDHPTGCKREREPNVYHRDHLDRLGQDYRELGLPEAVEALLPNDDLRSLLAAKRLVEAACKAVVTNPHQDFDHALLTACMDKLHWYV